MQGPSFEQTWIPFTRGCFVPSLLENWPWVLEKIFKFRYCILLFRTYLTWKRVGPFIWTNLSPHNPRVLCAKFSWNMHTGSSEEDFLNLVNVFSPFFNHLPFKKTRPLVWTNLYLLHPGMLCAKFGWNWPSGSGEENENVKRLQQRWQWTNFDQNLRLG